jgi:orotidine-5'-phosphate decarboxylase
VSQDTGGWASGPAGAFALGADYIVVGRPIRDAKDPKAAAEAIQASIAEALSE